MWSKDKTGVTEAKLLVDLRTQMFFQLFLESAEDGFQDWDTEAKIKEVLQIGSGGQLEQKKVQSRSLLYLLFMFHLIFLRWKGR